MTERILNPSHGEMPEELIERLRATPIFASMSAAELHCLDDAVELTLEKGEYLVKSGQDERRFCVLLSGRLDLTAKTSDGADLLMYTHQPGASFGELPLLAGIPSQVDILAPEPATVLVLDEEAFWRLLTACPEVRKIVLGNMALRLAKRQQASFQQEKMASLGTLAAGLMHELNNPGAAARRASAQLRENLMRMQRMGAKFSRTEMSMGQKQCMYELQEYAMAARPKVTLSSLEQADAEEALAAWMEQAGIEDSWRLAPTLVNIGMTQQDLACARGSFTGDLFSDALNWLEALVSSMQLVGTIEESIGRVSDLVMAVKSYAYEGKGPRQTVDVNQSIHATLVILGHKMREKQVAVAKELSPELPVLEAVCQGLNQVWTNLLDNAIDAVGQGGHVGIRTWLERANNGSPGKVCISVTDDGPGIPPECQGKIFDPFFTTKPVGVGTGLGLGIVYRIVEQYGGTVNFASGEDGTQFLVRLPAARAV